MVDPATPFSPDQVARVFPGAERVGPLSGNPAAAPVFRDGKTVGYIFSTRAVTGSTGYSGKPLDILVGLTLTGTITGARILEHHEPILVIGVRDQDLAAFVAQYAGLDIRAPVRLAGGKLLAGLRSAASVTEQDIDGISGASISTVVMNDAILRSARMVARSRGILAPGPGAKGGAAMVDFDRFEPANWKTLVAEGAVAHLQLTAGEVTAALAGGAPDGNAAGGNAAGGNTSDQGAKPEARGAADFAPAPDATFIDLYMALVTPAGIGRNLLGDQGYNRLMAARDPGDQVIMIAGSGLYSFKGTAYVRSGVFDRIQIVQGAKTLRLTAKHQQRQEALAIAGAPAFREIGLFTLPASSGFDPARPWRLELLVTARDWGEDEDATQFAAFSLPYTLPRRFFRTPVTGAAGATGGPGEMVSGPLWQDVWQAHPVKIGVLVLALIILTVALIFQDWIERRPRFYRLFRTGFLTFTLVWIGWYAGAQLSVVNVITFVQSLLTGFRWDFFLLGPLMFIMWGFVAMALLFWGRGVFCGWLCPFGALQELLNSAARALRVPQIKIPFAVHERLWMIKYILFLGLLGLSFYSISLTVVAAEVEPFKTAISLGFMREWPFVAFAVGLLVAGLFIERFYCRYLCALGAALAIPARLRMFEWLKRRPQCERECHICATRCTVGAIHPDGHINLNECIYCFNCQILYYDDHVCPPVIARRKRREAREAARRPDRAAAGASREPQGTQEPQGAE